MILSHTQAGGTGGEMGCKVACRGSRKSRHLVWDLPIKCLEGNQPIAICWWRLAFTSADELNRELSLTLFFSPYILTDMILNLSIQDFQGGIIKWFYLVFTLCNCHFLVLFLPLFCNRMEWHPMYHWESTFTAFRGITGAISWCFLLSDDICS